MSVATARLLNCTKKSIQRLKVKTLCVLTVSFAIPCFIVLLLVFRFYIFEAKINAVHLDDETDVMRLEHELGRVSVVFSGWEYFNNFNDSKLHITKPSRMEDSWANHGYWIFQSSRDVSKDPSIQLNNFQLPYANPVVLGIRFHMEGAARVDMTFRSVAAGGDRDWWSGESGKEETLIIRQTDDEEDEKDYAFCTKIIDPPFDGFINKVVIKVSTFTPSSFVAIDKIVMTIGRRDQGRQMMYTLMPDQWCKSVKTEVSQESASHSRNNNRTKRRRRRTPS